MSLLKSTLVQDVRGILHDNPWSTTATAASPSSSIVVPDTTKWDEGAILEFQDTGEQCWVQSITNATTMVTLRGFNGTTAAAHVAAGIVVYRDPAFSYFDITTQVELNIQELWPWVYKLVTKTIAPVATERWFDLDTTAFALISVNQAVTTSSPKYVYTYGVRGSGLPVTMARNLPTALVASGVGLYLPGGFAHSTANLTVNYAAMLTTTQTVSGTYDDISAGILEDTINFAVAADLVSNSENPRVTQEDINMADSSIQPGGRSRQGQVMYQQYIINRTIYAEQLRRTMPLMNNVSYGHASSGGNFGSLRPYWGN